jgi:5-aminopentanamidase
VVFYNSAALIDQSGAVVYVYRKVHLWSDSERAMFSAGDDTQLQVVALQPHDIRVGMLICYDVEYPESARILALQRAELLLVPTALCVSESNHVIPTCVVPTRAIENITFVAYCNFPPQAVTREMRKQWPKAVTFCGMSRIVAPDGRVLTHAEQPFAMTLVADIHARALRDYERRNPYMADRRPECYAAITMQQQQQ